MAVPVRMPLMSRWFELNNLDNNFKGLF